MDKTKHERYQFIAMVAELSQKGAKMVFLSGTTAASLCAFERWKEFLRMAGIKHKSRKRRTKLDSGSTVVFKSVTDDA